MNTLRVTLIFTMLMGLMLSMGTASATITYYPGTNQISVSSEPNGINLTGIYNELGNDTLLNHTGRVWDLHANLLSYDSTIYINSSDVDELIMDSDVQFQVGGDYIFDDVIITGGLETFTSGSIRNVSFRNGEGIRMDDVSGNVISNVSITDAASGIRILTGINIRIFDINITNISAGGILCDTCNNTKIYDIVIKDAGDYNNPGNGKGVWYQGSSNNSSAYNISINGTGWSSLEATSTVNNIHFYNATVINSGHNGLDLHGGNNVLCENLTINDSVANNVLITGVNTNVIVKNIWSYGSAGSSVQMGGALLNQLNGVQLENFYIEGLGFNIFSVTNLKIYNTTLISTGNGIAISNTYSPVLNASIIDMGFSNVDGTDVILYDSNNTKFVNTDGVVTYYYADHKAEHIKYYYSDILVSNNGINLSDMKIVFSSNTTGGQGQFSWNLINEGVYDRSITRKNEFITMINGHSGTPTVDDDSNVILISDYYEDNSTTKIYYNHTVNIYDTTNLWNVSQNIYANDTIEQITPLASININPNSTWYRVNPEIGQNTTQIDISYSKTNFTLTTNKTITVIPENDMNFSATWSGSALLTINSTIPAFASSNVSLKHNDVIIDTGIANAIGFISFSYTGSNGDFNITNEPNEPWVFNSSHTYTNVKYRYYTDGTRGIIGREPLISDIDMGDVNSRYQR